MNVINGIRRSARVDARSATSVLKAGVSHQFAGQVPKICDDKKSSSGRLFTSTPVLPKPAVTLA